jgi:hypothetical protein
MPSTVVAQIVLTYSWEPEFDQTLESVYNWAKQDAIPLMQSLIPVGSILGAPDAIDVTVSYK